jgi:hypothetical protein
MTRSTAVPILLLSALLSGCATARSDSHLLPMLIGSVRSVETEAAYQLSGDSSPDTYRVLIGILDKTVEDLRRMAWPGWESAAPKCPGGGHHCPDSKCTAFKGGDPFCTDFISRYRQRPKPSDLSWEFAESFSVLETEIFLRFAHAPDAAMANHLNSRLEQTWLEMRRLSP